MTPIAELPMEEVTRGEADSYRPGARLPAELELGFRSYRPAAQSGQGENGRRPDDYAIDHVSQYNEIIDISKGAAFGPTAGDPHPDLVQFVLALNRNSRWFRMGEGIAANMGQTISLGWVGPSLSIYADNDPFWDELAKTKSEKEIEEFLAKNADRVPVAVRIDYTNPLKLAVFLTTMRTFIEQTGPGLTVWESRKYKEQSYVRVSAAKGNAIPPQKPRR